MSDMCNLPTQQMTRVSHDGNTSVLETPILSVNVIRSPLSVEQLGHSNWIQKEQCLLGVVSHLHAECFHDLEYHENDK